MNISVPTTFTPFDQDNLSWVLDIYMDARNEYNASTPEESRTIGGFMQWTKANVLSEDVVRANPDVAVEIVFNFAFILTSPEFIEADLDEFDDYIDKYGDEDDTTMPGK